MYDKIHYNKNKIKAKKKKEWKVSGDLSGGPVAKTSVQGGLGSIPSQGTRFHMPNLICSNEERRSCMSQLRPGEAK